MVILRTDRLVLRHLREDDLDALAALYRDPEIRRYFPEGTLTLEETREEIAWFEDGHPQFPELGLWATLDRPTGRFIGRCGLLPWTLDGVAEVEVAYLLGKTWWGMGLATEAARAIAQHAFDRLAMTRLVCLVHPANAASARVAMKIGMTFERAAADDLGPYHLYATHRTAAPASPAE